MRVWQLALFLVVIAGLLAASAPFGDWTQEVADLRILAWDITHSNPLNFVELASWLAYGGSPGLQRPAARALHRSDLSVDEAWGLELLQLPSISLFNVAGFAQPPFSLEAPQLQRLTRRYPDSLALRTAWLVAESWAVEGWPRTLPSQAHLVLRTGALCKLLVLVAQAERDFPREGLFCLMQAGVQAKLGNYEATLAALERAHRAPEFHPFVAPSALALRAACRLLPSGDGALWVEYLAQSCWDVSSDRATWACVSSGHELLQRGQAPKSARLYAALARLVPRLTPLTGLPAVDYERQIEAYLPLAWGTELEGAVYAPLASYATSTSARLKAAFRSQEELPASPMELARQAHRERLRWLVVALGSLVGAALAIVLLLLVERGAAPLPERFRLGAWFAPQHREALVLAALTLALTLSPPSMLVWSFEPLMQFVKALFGVAIPACMLASMPLALLATLKSPHPRRAKPRKAWWRRPALAKRRSSLGPLLALFTALLVGRFGVAVAWQGGGKPALVAWLAALVLTIVLAVLMGRRSGRESALLTLLPGLAHRKRLLSNWLLAWVMMCVFVAAFCLSVATRFHALESREAEKVYTALMNPAPSDLPALPQELLDAARIFPD